MEGEGVHCFRRSFVSESDSSTETLSLDGMAGSPKLTKLVTGNCRSSLRKKVDRGCNGNCENQALSEMLKLFFIYL